VFPLGHRLAEGRSCRHDACFRDATVIKFSELFKNVIAVIGANIVYFKSLIQEYKLVLTGHSLGGGIAAILAILMKQDYPDLRCFSFAVPACSMK